MAEQIEVTQAEYIVMELGELHRVAQAELQKAMASPDATAMMEAMRLIVIVKLLGMTMQTIGQMG